MKSFTAFIKRVKDGEHKNGVSLTIKRRENGIVSEFCSDPDYANRSGLTNSGVTFYHAPGFHDLTQEQYTTWIDHLKNKENKRSFLETLAAENGVFVCLSGTKICALTRQMEEGRVIYSI